MLDKLDVAVSASDETERNQALEEGKKLLRERNKHILLAEKYGWEAIDCYVQEPLACDSDGEKRIKQAVKKSKALKAESKKPSKPRAQLFGRSWRSFTLSVKCCCIVMWQTNRIQCVRTNRNIKKASHPLLICPFLI